MMNEADINVQLAFYICLLSFLCNFKYATQIGVNASEGGHHYATNLQIKLSERQQKQRSKSENTNTTNVLVVSVLSLLQERIVILTCCSSCGMQQGFLEDLYMLLLHSWCPPEPSSTLLPILKVLKQGFLWLTLP